jgi:hypothetical protein
MIIDIEAKVQLDKHEFDATQTLIREFVESKKCVTKIEVAMDHEPRSNYGDFGFVTEFDLVGFRLKVQAIGKTGAKAVIELLEKLGANGGCSEPSRYPQLTDWVRAQPEGAKLLAVFDEEEPIPAVSAADAHDKQLDHCREYALHARMSGGYGYTAVWLSRETDHTCVNRIPNGISVYREVVNDK